MKRGTAIARVTSGGDYPISEDFLKKVSGVPNVFRYADLQIATNDFTAEIGRGGFGSVFKGTLADGKKVAVKRLHKADEGVEEFVAEVTALASLNHSNLVRLHGLCVEDSRYLLVYEFMENGSLYDWLFQSKTSTIDWKTRYEVALQTARALAYLHEESTSSILHLDVKPQNILLDENFRAKVSDFGMAKLLDEGESRLMTVHVKGTPGYIAPEWFLQYGISAKTDVYSYGMVLLEMVSGRRVVDRSADEENWYLPTIALVKAREGNLEEIFDSRLKVSDEEAVEMERIVKLALWCIQSSCGLRPTMSTVVGILEGSLEMLEPPLDQSLAFGPFVGGHVNNSSKISEQGIFQMVTKSSHQHLVLIAEGRD
ncbi:G-type lectin S-receptor-like serine/threonine-protein kinase SD2-5 [Cryptomeria japonica]|uniref:G-type lectin S-receptor-like serine/threonine-protein kinase SD2-5 n=1 Tax=Cryptomeria japonica TaxID=3369 RepID=UPI0025AC2F1E|nr:G-type lectin S-receptor-like serine/threonine-protein kinase SD2-5 [Cryptomeria japonica]